MEQAAPRSTRLVKGVGLVLAGAVGATVLTGIAWADSATEEQPAAQGAVPGEGRGHGGPGLHGQHRGAPGTGPLLHGEQVVRTPDGEYREIMIQNGTIAAVAGSSITVTSEDGFESTYAIDGDTVVHIDREESSPAALATDRPVRVVADADGTALRIGSMTAEGEAELEERRAERQERREQMREQAESRQLEGPVAQG